MDMKNYLDFVATQATLKSTPAFDPLGVNGNTTSGAETNLFGPANQRYLNYTGYSWDHNNVAGDGSGLDDTGLTWAQYTRKRGTIVDDQVRLIDPLDRALDADRQVRDVNYRLAWNQPHADNCDVPEAMAWIAEVVHQAGRGQSVRSASVGERRAARRAG
ncbi:hypothetical protein ACQPZX_32640 [Actinoplanes sp. CA-142083]|uniref:hypothetical protein n=1 Tax=Actinoplanes sp. CA-142083 TaxID=3239903 RepID=UPI003D8BC85B